MFRPHPLNGHLLTDAATASALCRNSQCLATLTSDFARRLTQLFECCSEVDCMLTTHTLLVALSV